MGSRDGVLKVAAQRLGMTLEAYLQRLKSGEKFCTRCKTWHEVSLFGPDPSRGDGRAATCLSSRRVVERKPHAGGSGKRGKAYAAPRDGDKEQARGRVNTLIRSGVIPDPNELPCHDCGHIWKKGRRRHEYDHHLGYAAEHHKSIQAVCTTCHKKRTNAVRRG